MSVSKDFRNILQCLKVLRKSSAYSCVHINLLGRKQCNTSMLLSNEEKGGVKQSIALMKRC